MKIFFATVLILFLYLSIQHKDDRTEYGGEDMNFIPQSIREHSDLPEVENQSKDNDVVNYYIEDFDMLLDVLASDYNVSEEAIKKLEESIVEIDEDELCSDYYQDYIDSYDEDYDRGVYYRGTRI